MKKLNQSPTTNVVAVSIPFRADNYVYLLNAQFRWEHKELKGDKWWYKIIAEVDGTPLKPVLAHEDQVVEETQIRPKMTVSHGTLTRGDLYVENAEDEKLPPYRKWNSGMIDKYGYLQINEGYYPPPNKYDSEETDAPLDVTDGNKS